MPACQLVIRTASIAPHLHAHLRRGHAHWAGCWGVSTYPLWRHLPPFDHLGGCPRAAPLPPPPPLPHSTGGTQPHKRRPRWLPWSPRDAATPRATPAGVFYGAEHGGAVWHARGRGDSRQPLRRRGGGLRRPILPREHSACLCICICTACAQHVHCMCTVHALRAHTHYMHALHRRKARAGYLTRPRSSAPPARVTEFTREMWEWRLAPAAAAAAPRHRCPEAPRLAPPCCPYGIRVDTGHGFVEHVCKNALIVSKYDKQVLSRIFAIHVGLFHDTYLLSRVYMYSFPRRRPRGVTRDTCVGECECAAARSAGASELGPGRGRRSRAPPRRAYPLGNR